MKNKELDCLITPADSGNRDSEEDKALLTFKKLREMLEKAQKLSDFGDSPNEERRGRFMRGTKKLCTSFCKTLKQMRQSLSQAKNTSF
ncbi:hypothetical protein AVEN_113635-1 [Araneus ventricosus]|uniref:Uncharacterized protein n=1 Tax=Araneus ventricosus TaxID=182803 RepID=A0A4Y2NMK6_ARAVE|nr:hypothetical protein AVEN_113635-1 [Araneus ventricosus]